MPDCVTLQKIEKTVARLNSRGIATLDDLRMCLGQDMETAIHWVSLHTGAPQALLLALLIAEVQDDASKKGNLRLLSYWRSLKSFPAVWSLSVIELGGIWRAQKLWVLWSGRKPVWAVLRQSFLRPRRAFYNWRKHWLDALIIALVLVVSTGLVLRAKSIGKPGTSHVAVKRGIGLPVFHQIDDQDLEMNSAPGSRGSFTKFDDVRGRYTLAAIAPGALLQDGQLLSLELSNKLRGLRILSVALRPTAYSATLVTPAEARLALSPRSPDGKIPAPAPFDVIVLSIETTGELKSAMLALSEANFVVAAPLLASHEAFLSQSIP